MNERIKQLLSQAISDVDYIHHDDVIDQELSEMFIPDVFAKRFAELLVKECAHIALMSNGNNLHVFELIKKHFGVDR